MTTDINNSGDLEILLRDFYETVLQDPIIGFYFTDVADFNLEAHLPRIRNFWEQQLFGQPPYRGRAFEAHLALHRHSALTGHHFHRWLYLFTTAIDRHFQGARATFLKQRAEAIALSMRDGLHRFDEDPDNATGVGYFEPPEALP